MHVDFTSEVSQCSDGSVEGSFCLRASRGGEAEADASVRRGAAAAEVS